MHRRAKRETSKLSPTIVTVVGRIVQAVALIPIVVGIVLILPLVRQFAGWRDGDGTFGDVYFAMLLATLPIAFGMTLLLTIEAALRRQSRLTRALAMHPEEPWLAEPQWRTNRLRLSDRPAIVALAAVAAAYAVYLVPAAIAFDWLLLKWAAGIAGAMILLFAVGRWRFRAWNTAELRLDTLPGVIGGPFTAVFVIDRLFPPDAVFEASLRCSYLPERRQGSSIHRIPLWGESQQISKRLQIDRPGATAIPLHFSIPATCPPTDLIDEPQRSPRDVEWSLTVQIRDRPGIGSSKFVVPVFVTAESSSDDVVDDELIADYLHVDEVESILQRDGIVESKTADGATEIVFARRDAGVMLAMSIVGAGCVAAIAASIYFIPVGPLVFFACLIPAFLLIAVGHALLDRFFWRCTVVVRDDHLDVTIGYAGLRRRFNLPKGGKTRLTCSVYSRSDVRENWKIDLKGESRTASRIVRSLQSRAEAERVQLWIARRIGVSVDQPSAAGGFENAS